MEPNKKGGELGLSNTLWAVCSVRACWRRALWLLLGCLLGVSGAVWAQPKPDAPGAVPADTRPLLTLGVFAYRPKPVMLQRFNALGDFLSARVPGYRFQCKL